MTKLNLKQTEGWRKLAGVGEGVEVAGFTAELGMREVDGVLEKGTLMSTMLEIFPPCTILGVPNAGANIVRIARSSKATQD